MAYEDPIEIGNVAETVHQNLGNLESVLQPVDEQESMNIGYRLQNESKEMDQLMAFAKRGVDAVENRIKRGILKDEARGQTDKAMYDAEHRKKLQEIDRKIDTVKNSEDRANELDALMKERAEHIKKEDYFASKVFLSRSPKRQQAAERQFAQQEAGTWDFFGQHPEAMKIRDPNTFHGLLTSYNENKMFNYLDQLGDSKPRQDFLDEYWHKPVNQKVQHAIQTWEAGVIKQDQIDEGIKRQQQIVTAITKGVEAPAEVIGRTLKDYASDAGMDMSAAKAQLASDLTGLAGTNELPETWLEALATGKIPHHKTGELVNIKGGLFSDDQVEAIEKAHFGALKEANTQDATKKKSVRIGVTNEYLASYNDPDFVTKLEKEGISYSDWLQDLQDKYTLANNGVASPLLEAAQAAETNGDQDTYSDHEKEILRLKGLSQLSEAYLRDPNKLIPRSLIDKYMSDAQKQDKERPNMETYRKDLGAYLKARAGGTINPGATDKVTDLAFHLMNDIVNTRLTNNPGLDRGQVEAEAYKRVEKWIEDEINTNKEFLGAHGFNVGAIYNKVLGMEKDDQGAMVPYSDTLLNSNDRAAIKKLRGYLASFGSNAASITNPLKDLGPDGEKQTKFFTYTQLENASQGYGSPGWVANPTLQWLADERNTNVVSILNAQRKAVGLDPLPLTYRELQIQHTADLEAKRRLRQNPDNATVEAQASFKGTWKEIDPDPNVEGDEYNVPIAQGEPKTSTTGIQNPLQLGEYLTANNIALSPASIAITRSLEDAGYSREEILDPNSYANELYREKYLTFIESMEEKTQYLHQNFLRPGIAIPNINR